MDTNVTLRGYPVVVSPPDRYRGLMLKVVGPKPVKIEIRPDSRAWEGAKDRFNVVGVYPTFEWTFFVGCTRADAEQLVAQVPSEFCQEIRLWRDRDGTPRGHSDCGVEDPLHIGRLTEEEATLLVGIRETLVAALPQPRAALSASLMNTALAAKDAVPMGLSPEDHRPYVEAALAYWTERVNATFDTDNTAASFHAVEQQRLFQASLDRLAGSKGASPA